MLRTTLAHSRKTAYLKSSAILLALSFTEIINPAHANDVSSYYPVYGAAGSDNLIGDGLVGDDVILNDTDCLECKYRYRRIVDLSARLWWQRRQRICQRRQWRRWLFAAFLHRHYGNKHRRFHCRSGWRGRKRDSVAVMATGGSVATVRPTPTFPRQPQGNLSPMLMAVPEESVMVPATAVELEARQRRRPPVQRQVILLL